MQGAPPVDFIDGPSLFILLLIAGLLFTIIVLVIKVYLAAKHSPRFASAFGTLGKTSLLLLLGIGLVAVMIFAPGLWLLLLILNLGVLALILLNRRHTRPRFQPAATQFCPPVLRLKDLLADKLSQEEQAQLNRHLERCPACQHRLEGLVAGKESWSGLVKQLSQPPQREPALKQVMDNLKREPDPEPTRDEPAINADLPLGFLSPPDKPDQLGRLGPYEVLAEIGRGGMGIVLKAFDPTLHRVVAIKVLAPQLATSGVARKRFMREAQAVAAITHDHIVTIHAVEEANGLPYLVMQYVPGQSLQDRIDQEGPLPLKEILRIGMQTAAGLAAAHAQGIVHRDIKPANILLENGVQRVKLTDFGLARAVDDASLTQSGFVAGSPQFMAPEQARGEALDHRADLFSLGSVLYTLCTGRPPFRAANTFAVLRRVGEDTPRPIREVNPEIPEWLAAVVDKLHAKEPAQRYQSAGEVAEVLGRHLAELQQAAYVPPPLPAPKPVGAASDPDGLLTSLTICPGCGAQLHVPERMVGGTVHCPECGKPFRVEEGSEEIHIARAVQPALVPPLQSRKRMSAWPWLLGGAAVLLFMLCLGVLRLYTVGYSTLEPQMAHPVMSEVPWPDGGVKELIPEGKPWPEFWKNALNWFPEDATLFGALDFTKLTPLTLEDDFTQTVLRLTVPAAGRNLLTTEKLGPVRIDGASFAYYADPKQPDKSRQIVQLEGLLLGGRKRLNEFLSHAAPGKIMVEGDRRWAARAPSGDTPNHGPGYPLRVSGVDLPLAVGILNDRRVFLAGYVGGRVLGPEHLKVLDELPWFRFSGKPRRWTSIPKGYMAPWLTSALAKTPSAACGVMAGELPAHWRQSLTTKLGLPTCPRTICVQMVRNPGGLDVWLSLNVEKSGADEELLQTIRQWQERAVELLKAKFAPLQAGSEQGSLNLVGQTLAGIHLEAGGGSVRGWFRISDASLPVFGEVLQQIALTVEDRWELP